MSSTETRRGVPSVPRRIVAVGLFALAWAGALGSVLMTWLLQLPEQPLPGVFLSTSPPEMLARFDDIGVVVALLYAPVAALLIWRRPHPVAWIVVIHVVGSALTALSVQYGLLAREVGGLPLDGVIAHVAGWAYLPGTALTTVVPLLLVPGVPRGARRAFLAAGTAVAVLATVSGLLHQAEGAPVNPLAPEAPGLQAATEALYGSAVSLGAALSWVTTAVVALLWLRTPRSHSRPLGWLLLGHALISASYSALVVPASAGLPPWVLEFGMVAPVVGQVFYPAAILVMVLGPRVLGIDAGVARIILWSVLAVLAVAAYLVLLRVFELLRWDGEVAGVVAAAGVALGLQLLRPWVASRVVGLVYREGEGPGDLVRRLGERVGELESGSQGLDALADALRRTFRLGSVVVRSTAHPALSSQGSARGDAVVPLRVGEVEVGVVELDARGGERVPARTIRGVRQLSGVLAVALLLAEADRRLNRSRDDVLAIRQEERRTLRRELHDGVGPALAGVAFGLAAAERMRERDPDGARALATRLLREAEERAVELRDIAGSMAPPPIASLAGELEELAAAFEGAGPVVELDAAEADAIPLPARRAALLIASEAVHNAVRHAGASTIRIRVTRVADEVELSVRDDGTGFADLRSRTGVGLASMREHAAAVGARLMLDSRPGAGTVLTAAFSLPAEPQMTQREKEKEEAGVGYG